MKGWKINRRKVLVCLLVVVCLFCVTMIEIRLTTHFCAHSLNLRTEESLAFVFSQDSVVCIDRTTGLDPFLGKLAEWKLVEKSQGPKRWILVHKTNRYGTDGTTVFYNMLRNRAKLYLEWSEQHPILARRVWQKVFRCLRSGRFRDRLLAESICSRILTLQTNADFQEMLEIQKHDIQRLFPEQKGSFLGVRHGAR